MWKWLLGTLCVLLGTPVAVETPRAIVSFSFDDVPQSVMTVGLPLLQQAGYPATVYVTVGNTIYDGYMSWDDIAAVAAVGWEIGAHTQSHEDLTTLSDEAIVADFTASNVAFLLHGYRPTTFATPFGAYDERVLAHIATYYESHRTAWPNGSNLLAVDPYRIISYAVDRDTTFAEVQAVLADLQKNGGWVVVQLHHLFPAGEVVEEKYGTNLLEAMVAEVQKYNFTVLTVSEALAQLQERE